MPTRSRNALRLFLYSAVTLLIATAFLAEMVQGGCPVP